MSKKKEPPKPHKRFPPVPDWQPSIVQPVDRISDRIRHYTNGSRDFAIFEHGTCMILDDGLSDEQAERVAKDALHKIFHAHPDVRPMKMDDGNILVRYNHPAVNVVFSDIVQANWPEIERRHQEALSTDEVLVTPLGRNAFDDFGKQALFGRCFMFMDAQNPKIVRLVRKAI